MTSTRRQIAYIAAIVREGFAHCAPNARGEILTTSTSRQIAYIAAIVREGFAHCAPNARGEILTTSTRRQIVYIASIVRMLPLLPCDIVYRRSTPPFCGVEPNADNIVRL